MAEDRFLVHFVRSGGLAGASLRATVDSADLPQPETEELRRLVDRVELAPPSPPPRGADRFQYDITVDRGGRSRIFTTYDGSMAPELKALIDWLLSNARPSRGAS